MRYHRSTKKTNETTFGRGDLECLQDYAELLWFEGSCGVNQVSECGRAKYDSMIADGNCPIDVCLGRRLNHAMGEVVFALAQAMKWSAEELDGGLTGCKEVGLGPCATFTARASCFAFEGHRVVVIVQDECSILPVNLAYSGVAWRVAQMMRSRMRERGGMSPRAALLSSWDEEFVEMCRERMESIPLREMVSNEEATLTVSVGMIGEDEVRRSRAGECLFALRAFSLVADEEGRIGRGSEANRDMVLVEGVVPSVGSPIGDM